MCVHAFVLVVSYCGCLCYPLVSSVTSVRSHVVSDCSLLYCLSLCVCLTLLYRPVAVGANFCMLSTMLVNHKCTVTIEENAFLQCFAATQAASAIWLANSISACIHIIIPKSWRANCLRNRTALQKRVFLNRHCTFVVHQHGRQHAEVYENIAEVQTVYIRYLSLHVWWLCFSVKIEVRLSQSVGVN